MLVYYFVPKAAKMPVMVAASFVFYAWGSPKFLLLLVLSMLFNYATGLELGKFVKDENKTAARITVIIAAAANLFVLCFFKYSTLGFPIGISFYTFSALSYVLDIYWRNEEPARNPLELAVYISFFPKITSGPIVQFRDFRKQLSEAVMTRTGIGIGLNQFMMGLFKKVLIADNLGTAFSAITALPQMSGASAWLGMVFYSLQLYFDFSGYSDMAIGIARMMGFRFSANFNYPYLSKNVSEFWRRWHISLGAFFRDYVYIPLGGTRCSSLMQLRNLGVVWLLTGIWHGSTLNFVVWGLYHGAFVVLERFVIKDKMDRVPQAVRILLTDLITFIGWVFFFSPGLGSAVRYLGKMVGRDGLGFFDGTAAYYLKSNWLLLLVAVLCCTPLIKQLHDVLAYHRSNRMAKVSIALYLVLFAFCIASMVGSTYSTFLYAAF